MTVKYQALFPLANYLTMRLLYHPKMCPQRRVTEDTSEDDASCDEDGLELEDDAEYMGFSIFLPFL